MNGHPKTAISISILLLLTVLAPCLPACCQEQTPSFPLGSKVSRSLQKWTGLNLISGLVASSLITAGLRFKLDGRVKAKVKTYSFTDLLSGKLKSVELSLKNASYRGIPLGNVHITTATPVWLRYFSGRNGRAGLRTPILVKVKGEIGEADISRALVADQIASKLSMIKLDLPGLGVQYLEFKEPAVDFKGRRIEIVSRLVTRGASPDTGVTVKLTGKPSLVERSKIVVEELTVESADIIKPEEFARFAGELLNPIFDLSKLDRQTHAVRLDSLNFNDNDARFEGSIILAPRPVKISEKERPGSLRLKTSSKI